MNDGGLGRWTRIRRLAGAWLNDRRQFRAGRLERTCPICGYHGVFISVGHPGRWDARCLSCGSRERHRLLHLWVSEGGGDKFAGKRILQFAPEKAVMRRMPSSQNPAVSSPIARVSTSSLNALCSS